MTYIRSLDPDPDPEMDRPLTCEHCGWSGTQEDYFPVRTRSSTVYLCPQCGYPNL